jgi:hypothetical protein
VCARRAAIERERLRLLFEDGDEPRDPLREQRAPADVQSGRAEGVVEREEPAGVAADATEWQRGISRVSQMLEGEPQLLLREQHRPRFATAHVVGACHADRAIPRARHRRDRRFVNLDERPSALERRHDEVDDLRRGPLRPPIGERQWGREWIGDWCSDRESVGEQRVEFLDHALSA